MSTVENTAIRWPLTGYNNRVDCPLCGKSVYGFGGLSQHLKALHPDHHSAFIRAQKTADKNEKRKARDAADEVAARAVRQITITGEFADEIIGEIKSLIGMMEPYYAQCPNATESADDIVNRLDALATGAP